MIGNAWPVGDTGWTVLEQGALDPQTLQLRVTGWLVADPHGNTGAAVYAARAAAEAAARAAWSQKRHSG